MGRLKTRSRERDEGREEDAQQKYYDLSGVVFTRYRPQQIINLTRLSQQDPLAWNLAWGSIKRNRPELAELLKDPNLHALNDAMGDGIHIEV